MKDLQFTVINDIHEVATKTYSLTSDRQLHKECSANFEYGEAYKLKISLSEFNEDVLRSFTPGFFLLQGVNESQVAITPADISNTEITDSSKKTIRPKHDSYCTDSDLQRCKEHFPFSKEPGLMVIDSDDLHQYQNIRTQSDLFAALINIDPAFASAKLVMSSSSSSYISVKDENGEFQQVNGLKGNHTFVPVLSTESNPDILKTLHLKAIDNGYYNVKISETTGRARVCSIIDEAMNRSVQPVFCAPPVIADTDIQSSKEIRVFGEDKGLLDPKKIKKLKKVEEAAIQEKIRSLKKEAEATEKAREYQQAYQQNRIKKLRNYYPNATDSELLRLIKNELENYVLDESHQITLSNGKKVFVKEILDNPKDYHGKDCNHPIENDIEGKCKIYCDQPKPTIHSFAHGGETFSITRSSDVTTSPWYLEYEKKMEEFNKTHSTVSLSGSTIIVSEYKSSKTGQVKYEMDNIKNYIYDNSANKTCTPKEIYVHGETEPVIAPEPVIKSIPEAWKDWKGRTRYRGVEYAPDGLVEEGYLNTWTGFAVNPNFDVDITPLINHIKDIIASGDEQVAEYILNWCAHIIQKPSEKTGSVIILQGREGIGKSILTDTLSSIFGEHAKVTERGDSITGKFNDLLMNRTLIVSEEALFHGDKKGVNVFKSLITSNSMVIETKGMPQFQTRNCLNFILCTNEDHVVSMGADSRRFLTVKVSDEMKGNDEYFAPLVALKKSPEAWGALLQYFMDRDISNFNPRKMPETEANKNQRLNSLESDAAWLVSSLYKGYFELSYRIINEDSGSLWKERMSFQDLEKSYTFYCNENRINEHKRKSNNKVGRLLGQYFDKRNGSNGSREYVIGDINDARRKVADALKISLEDVGLQEAMDRKANSGVVPIDLFRVKPSLKNLDKLTANSDIKVSIT